MGFISYEYKRQKLNAWRAKNRELVNQQSREYRRANKERLDLIKNKPENQLKIKARSILNVAVKSGRIVRLPCKVCGELPTEAHHLDYNKPLEVEWLCSIHHKELSQEYDN